MKNESLQVRNREWIKEPGSSTDADLPSVLRPETPNSEPSAAIVTEALQFILESAFFRSSKRGKQFLNFVVQYRLDNPPDPLKERTIGVALFNRSADYATGDDSVVRAQAREVRRRLEQYYVSCPHDSPIRIDLPLGSYSPEFRWVATPSAAQEDHPGLEPLAVAHSVIDSSVSHSAATSPAAPFTRRRLLFGSAAAILCGLGLWLAADLARKTEPKSTISQFWSPAFTSSKPLLICLPKPILYRPSAALYKRTAQSPGEFDREVDRMTHRPHLRPEDSVRWSDMIEYYDYGISEGDVQAAVKLSGFLGRQGKDSEVRIGGGYSSEDLRNSPAVIIGAFSNPWTMEMTSGLHFAFVDDDKGIRIQEQGPSGRFWYTKHGPTGEDYGLVTRLVDSSTGQFVVLVAGVEASGSDAAADLVIHPDALEKLLRDAPKDWSQRNVQILVSTTVKDSVAGPARIIDVYVW
jgi:hypothetical protein